MSSIERSRRRLCCTWPWMPTKSPQVRVNGAQEGLSIHVLSVTIAVR